MTLPTTIPYKLIAGLVGVAVLIGTFVWLIESRDGFRDKAATNEQLYHGEQAAHRLTVANYRAQAAVATKADADNVARVKSEQAAINQRTSHDYEARIADARAHASRLQQQLASAGSHPSSPSATPVSVAGQYPTGTPGAAEEGELSASDALIATEQAIQLDELINAVNGQSAINVNGTK